MLVKERKTYREEELAKLLNVTVEEVFDKIPIPESAFELAARINKKKALGLDASVEESIRKTRLLEMDIKRMREEIKSEPPLKPQQVAKLVDLVRGVIDELQPRLNAEI